MMRLIITSVFRDMFYFPNILYSLFRSFAIKNSDSYVFMVRIFLKRSSNS